MILDYSHHYEYADCLEVGPDYSNGLEQAPKFFFLPSLLGPGDANISEIWTYKTAESWKTTICHSILFPDGVPPGLMVSHLELARLPVHTARTSLLD